MYLHMPKGIIRGKMLLLAAAVAVFLTAFETRQPVFQFGSLAFTITEVAAILFLTCFSLAAWSERRGLLTSRVLDAVVLIFLASNIVSVLFAEDVTGALKFTLRMAFAAMLYFGISRLPSRLPAQLWIGAAITAALIVVIVVGLLENFVHAVNWGYWLSPWQESSATFGMFNRRIAATLPFPTVLSVYLELVSPLALAFGLAMLLSFKSNTAARRWLTTSLIVGVIMLSLAQLFTYTRSALVAFPVSMLACSLLAVISGLGRRIAAFFALPGILLILFAIGSAVTTNTMASRIGVAEDVRDFGAEYTIIHLPESIKPGQDAQASLSIMNTSDVTWETSNENEMFLGTRWFKGTQQVRTNGSFTLIPRDVAPGESIDLDFIFHAPADPGRYILAIEFVQNGEWWSASRHVRPAIVALDMTEQGSRVVSLPDEQTRFIWFHETPATPSRRALWQAAYDMWRDNPVFGVGPDQFRMRYGEYLADVPSDQRIRANNMYLEAAANTGAVGLFALLLLLGAAAWYQLKLIQMRLMYSGKRVVSLALFAALLGFAAHGMMDNFLWLNGISFIFFTQLGLTSWMYHEK